MKNKLHVFWIYLILFLFQFTNLSAQSKEDTVFTIPFHMDAKLLVFKGKMNGNEIDFAFDTGAVQGLAGSNVIEKGGISKTIKKTTLSDANHSKKKVKIGTTDLMEIGGFKISNAKSILSDMPYLVCHDYYLLGSNVIQQLNWKIDFDNNLIHVSLKPFATDNHYFKIPVTYINTRPFLTLSFEGMTYKSILIDSGFSGVLDLSDKKDEIQEFLSTKRSESLDNPQISLNTGAISQIISPTSTILLKQLKIADRNFSNIPINFESPTTEKIGIQFFAHLTHETIINNSEKAYFLNLKEKPGNFEDPNHLNLNYKKGKVLIAGKSIGLSPEDNEVEIGEEVLAINGIRSSSFEDECQFNTWYYSLNQNQITITKLDGREITFRRTALK